jgi:hypothetical protein
MRFPNEPGMARHFRSGQEIENGGNRKPCFSASEPTKARDGFFQCFLWITGAITMRIIEAEPQIVTDLRDEGNLVVQQRHGDFTVYAVRHPTLGKVVIVEGRDGSGLIVETEE